MRVRLLALLGVMLLAVPAAKGMGSLIPSPGVVHYIVRGAEDKVYLQDAGRPLRVRVRHTDWDSQPFWSPDRQRTVYLRRAPNALEFMIVTAFSSQREFISVPLPPEDEVDARFARLEWARDSQQFAYVVFLMPKNLRDAPTAQLFALSVDGEVLYQGQGQAAAFGSLYWSPDGDTLLELSRVNDRDGDFLLGMERINIEQGQVQTIEVSEAVDDLNTGSGGWSPDGQTFAFQGGETDQLDRFLYLLDDDGTLRQITDEPGLVGVTFAWSPDSTRLAIATPNRFVNIIDVASGNVVERIDAGPGTFAEPVTWLPNGRGMVISWLIKADAPSSTQYVGLWRDGELTDMGVFEGGLVDMAWSPDETEVIFNVRDRSQWDLYHMGVADTQITPLTEQGLVNRWVGWSANGEWLLFQSDRTGDARLYVMRPDGTDIRAISPTGDPICCAGWWKK